MNEKLFHRNFLLVVIGQIISLFGNAILRFALPLYLLNETGSAAIFGFVMAISMIPTILLSPFGGIAADRLNKRNIMVVLDFTTAFLVILFAVFCTVLSPVLLVCVMLLCLAAIQAFYQPSVQASIPILSSEKNLLKSNAVINQISALSGLLGPVAGGMLYGIWGIMPIIYIGGISFLSSAVMELFIHIPSVKQTVTGKIGTVIWRDFKESMNFIIKERKEIFYAILVAAAFNLFISCMFMIGIPAIIKIELNLPDQFYSISQAVTAAGALCGGILTGFLSNKLKIEKFYWILIYCGFCAVPIGAALKLGFSSNLTFAIILVCGFLFMACGTIFSINMLALIQAQTPQHLIGKIISYVLALAMCSYPVGQAVYGQLFSVFHGRTYWVVFAGTIITIIIAFCSGNIFKKFNECL